MALEIASWMLKAFCGDAPAFYWPGSRPTHAYRDILMSVLSKLRVAVGSTGVLLVVMDGARYWPKAVEHARRGHAVDRDKIMQDAAEAT